MSAIRRTLVAALTRRYPFISGCGAIANCQLVRLATGRYNGLVWARNDRGQHLRVPADDYVGRSIYYVGDLDRKLSRLIDQIVRPGDTVLDIGANLGIVAIPLATLVGPTGRVHAFEPNPALVDLLTESLQRNQIENVELHRFALGREPGVLPLHLHESNAGRGTLLVGTMQSSRQVDVEIRRLDDVVEQASIGPVRLVKIDVEGFEAEVFLGARRWLGSTPPDTILFEFNHGYDDFWTAPLIALLRESHFDLFAIPKRLTSVRLVPITPGEAAPLISHDILAVHSQAHLPALSKLRG